MNFFLKKSLDSSCLAIKQLALSTGVSSTRANQCLIFSYAKTELSREIISLYFFNI